MVDQSRETKFMQMTSTQLELGTIGQGIDDFIYMRKYENPYVRKNFLDVHLIHDGFIYLSIENRKLINS